MDDYAELKARVEKVKERLFVMLEQERKDFGFHPNAYRVLDTFSLDSVLSVDLVDLLLDLGAK